MQKGHKRDLSIEHGPRDKLSRRFSASAYNRVLPNGESVIENALYTSKSLTKYFVCCCKLLRKGLVRGSLANDGFNDWIHLNNSLKKH